MIKFLKIQINFFKKTILTLLVGFPCIAFSSESGITYFPMNKAKLAQVSGLVDFYSQLSFRKISFYWIDLNDEKKEIWRSVGIKSETEKGGYEYQLTSTEGPEQSLTEWRFAFINKKPYLLKGTKIEEKGAQPIEAFPVEITYYLLKEGDDLLPPHYFEKHKKEVTKKKYSDAATALSDIVLVK